MEPTGYLELKMNKSPAEENFTSPEEYQKVVKSHPVTATSVTRTEKHKNKKKKKKGETPEEKLEKQAMEARVKNSVKKW